METCPHCKKDTIPLKGKLSLAPGECFICPNCNTKLTLDKKVFFIHTLYMALVGYSIFNLNILAALAILVGGALLAFFLLIKVVPFKMIE
jgi:hypothetical protein